MEIRDPIHGTIELSPFTVAVIDSFPYQRLRAIKQLGFAEFSFPGATHNRYLHSIGVHHLAARAFDSIFRDHKFSSVKKYKQFRQCLQMAALLHDIGHGPLSHATEEVMPPLKDLRIAAYKNLRQDIAPTPRPPEAQANHEDYTIKFITDSSLTPILQQVADGFEPLHIACLIDKTLQAPDQFFADNGLDFRNILSQLVSSEMDCDRMDYLERDAYFCGTNYGRVELSWLLGNLSYHVINDKVYLALNRRALYAFDDFLLARHHMHLMVYFHHKSIIYEEFLNRYLSSPDCAFRLPADIEAYIHCTDYALYQHLGSVDNEWARRISKRETYKVLFELHSTHPSDRVEKMEAALKAEGIVPIHVNSTARLSKYHSASTMESSFPIYVVDQYDRLAKPYPIEESTEIFQKYEEIRRIERLYVDREQFSAAEAILTDHRL